MTVGLIEKELTMSDFLVENGILKKYTGAGGDVIIPDGVTGIGDWAFCLCKSLKSVTLPDSVLSIGKRAFDSCRSLTEVNLPRGIIEIGDYAFSECTSLKSITIPESVSSIGDYAFSECTSLKNIIIPDSVASIGKGAFSECPKLADAKGFSVVNGVLYGYYGTAGDIVIPDGVKVIDERVFNGMEFLTSIKIPDGVAAIKALAFNGCRSLTRIDIPETVKRISIPLYGTFYGCSNMQIIRMPKDLLDSLEGSLFYPSTKMITMELTEAGSVIAVLPALFRKEYPSDPKWIHSDDYLVPLGDEDISLFDNVVAAGAYDGFNTNEDGRISAILWRLNIDRPIKTEFIPNIRDFLSSKLTKVIKIAITENARENIRKLVSIGVITEENQKKVSTMLAKSEDNSVKSIAGDLGELLAGDPSSKQANPGSPLEEKYRIEYEKSGTLSKIVKYGIEIPEMKAADGNGMVPKEYLELFISMYMDKAEFIPLADEAVQKIDRKSMNDVLLKIFERQATKNNKLALLNAVMRFADDDTVRTIYRTLADSFNWHLVRDAILLNDSKAAMMIADKEKFLDKYAELRGTDADTLRDTVLADFGFDTDGKKEYDLGITTVTVSLQKDLTLALFDAKQNKSVKSIPKKGNDESLVAAASADFDELKKNVKKVAKNRADHLFEDFLSGNRTDGARWKSIYFVNPLLRHVAGLIVWEQSGVTFTLKDGAPVRSNGDRYEVTDAGICVAHPIEMKPDDVDSWQKYFVSSGLKQPFAQIWERAIDPSTIREDRYEGCTVPAVFFRGAEKHGLGLHENDYFDTVFKIYVPGCHLEGGRTEEYPHRLLPDETFTLGEFTVWEYSRKVNHLVTVLDRWTILERIKKDDVNIEPMLGSFTLAQITEFIATAQKNNAVNVTALLLNYKNSEYSDFDPMEEFVL